MNVEVTVEINSKPVVGKLCLLPADLFGTALLFFFIYRYWTKWLSISQITHKLYDSHEETRIAQEIILGIGGVKVLEALNYKVDIYHMNEGHSLPLTFELYKINLKQDKELF